MSDRHRHHRGTQTVQQLIACIRSRPARPRFRSKHVEPALRAIHVHDAVHAKRNALPVFTGDLLDATNHLPAPWSTTRAGRAESPAPAVATSTSVVHRVAAEQTGAGGAQLPAVPAINPDRSRSRRVPTGAGGAGVPRPAPSAPAIAASLHHRHAWA